jgi:hypothetical protein
MKLHLPLLLLLAAVPALAVSPEAPTAISSKDRAAIVDEIAAALRDSYVFPDVALRMEEQVRRQLRKSSAFMGQPFGATAERRGLFRKSSCLSADAFGEAPICQGRSPEPTGGSAKPIGVSPEPIGDSPRDSRESDIDSGNPAIGFGHAAIGSGESAIGSGEAAIGSGESAIDSDEVAIGSGKSAIGSGELRPLHPGTPPALNGPFSRCSAKPRHNGHMQWLLPIHRLAGASWEI